MKRKLACLLLAWAAVASAQEAAKEPTGGITVALLEEIQNSLTADVHSRFALNALAQMDAKKIAPDWNRMRAVDTHFSHTLPPQKITDQKASGRCWIFAGLNILRPVAAKKLNMDDFEFSENYLFFYDKLEKANLFLEAIRRTRERPLNDRMVEFLFRNPIDDGGQWTSLVELIRKYGVVPLDVMPETYSSVNTATFNHTLSMKLREKALAIRRSAADADTAAIKLQALKEVYRILALNLGLPPKTFSWRSEDRKKKLGAFKTYTPLEFYQETTAADLDNYFALYSIANRPYDRLFQIELDKTMYDRPNLTFVNTSIDTLKLLARASILDNEPVWFGCDMTQDVFRDSGLMMPGIYDYAAIYGLDFTLSRADMFESYAISANHAMLLCGVDIVDGQVRKWLVENSWGEQIGKKGYLHMLDEWFGHFVLMIIVHKNFIPPRLLALYQTEPEVLPPWDPMYRAVTLERP